MNPLAKRIHPAIQLGQWLWRLVSFQWLRKVGAILCAVALWSLATTDRRGTVERLLEVPVKIIDSSSKADKRTVLGIPSTVKVRLSGQASRIESLLAERIEADVDISGLGEGPFQSKVVVRPPAETQLVAVQPDQVSGTLEAAGSKNFAVEIGSGKISETDLVRLTSAPSSVQAQASKATLERIARVISLPLRLEPGEQRPAGLLAVDAQDQPILNITFEPTQVMVSRVDLGKLPVKNIPVKLAPLPLEWHLQEVQFSPKTVRVLGSPQVLAKLTSLEVNVVLRTGNYTTPAQPNPLPGVQVLDLITATLKMQKR